MARTKRKPLLWNYRAVYHADGTIGVHAAFYRDGPGVPTSITEAPVPVVGHSPKELREQLERMLHAIDLPHLPYQKTVASPKKTRTKKTKK